MNLRKSTAAYEEWLSHELEIVPDDIVHKHRLMREAIFPFFRATFYRFAQLWPDVCPECDNAPQLLAVGDLHLENFGTWRDSEGRLIWGINDFDEASRMPYTIDLVRLAASAHLAVADKELTVGARDACAAILAGYKESLEAGGLPWVLGGKHPWLYQMVKPGLRDPPLFWHKLESLPAFSGRIPGGARRGLERMMAVTSSKWRVVHRVAGMGSLGRQRFVAIALAVVISVLREILEEPRSRDHRRHRTAYGLGLAKPGNTPICGEEGKPEEAPDAFVAGTGTTGPTGGAYAAGCTLIM